MFKSLVPVDDYVYIQQHLISRVQFKYREMMDIKKNLWRNDTCLCITYALVKKKQLNLPYISNVTDTISKLHFVMCAPWYIEFCITVVVHF